MADYKIPNLCGASVKFNAIQSKLDTMISNAIDGLEVDASALKATMDTDVTSLVSDLKSMIPELPALPDVNLQGQLTSLAGLSAGSGQYKRLLADVTSKFGSGLTAGGFSLDTLVSDAASAITGGTDLCSAVPNFGVPAAGGDAVQKAVEVLQAEKDSLPEKLSILVENDNFTAAKTAVEETFTSYEEIGEEVPAEDIGPYRVAEETTKIVVSDNQGSTTTIEATTPKNSVGASTTVTTVKTTKTETITESGGTVTEIKRSNVAKKGFTRRTVRIKEYILLDDVAGFFDLEFTLKNTPISIGSVWGYDPTGRKGRGRWWYIAKASSRLTIVDSYTLDGQKMTVTSDVHEYDEDSKGYMFRVKYKYLDYYDPNFAGPL